MSSTPPLDSPPDDQAGVPTDEVIARLRAWQRLTDASPPSTSWKARAVWTVRRGLARLLVRQEAFNATVVGYLARVAAHVNAAVRSLESADRALEAGQQELRDAVGSLHHAVRGLTHEAAARTTAGAGAAVSTEAPAGAYAASSMYVGFEDRFRGPQDDIRAAQESYLPIFASAGDVLDIGCGRGEFLALLRASGVRARGIDLNGAMVALCREQGLEAETADALAFLRAQPDASIGGLFAAQVVEHLEPGYLVRVLDEALRALRPGAPLVLETINVASWSAFFESYVRDITHARPLHPETLRFLLIASGFQEVEIRYRAPYPEHAKLQPIPATPALGDAAAATLNANVETLNRLLFGPMDYAVIGFAPKGRIQV